MTDNKQIIEAEKQQTQGSELIPFGSNMQMESPGMHPAANVKRTIQLGLAVVLLVFGGLGTWAAVAQLSGAVIGVGEIKVDMNRKTVQHLEGGIVSEILVRDGDHVEQGEVLIIIEDERISASVELLQGQLNAELAKAARLIAERDEQEKIQFPDTLISKSSDPEVAELMKAETNYFETKRRILLDQISLLKNKIEEINEEAKGLNEQTVANEQSIVLLEEEIEANESLEKNQFMSKNQIRTLKRTVQDYKARIGDNRADVARAQQKISDMELRIVSLRDEYVQAAAQELTGRHSTGVQAKIFDLQARLRPSLDAKKRQKVTAPISGTVVDLKVFTVGGVITPRQPLMDIVPDEYSLIIEAKIAVESIKNVHPGQDTDIRLTAYPSRTTPLVEGRVTYVSADRLTDSRTEKSYYLAHIDVDRQSLADAGDLELSPGMSAEVFIKTGERTALDLMLSPLTESMHRTLREP